MKLHLYIICILLSTYSQVKTQTLKETEEWIKQKFEEYEANMKNEITTYTSKGNSVKTYITRVTSYPDFSHKGELWITYNKYSSVTGSTKSTLYIIPIRHMKSVKYDATDDCVFILFSVKNADKSSRSDNIRVLESNSKVFNDSYIEFGIEFDKKFLEDDMPARFKKAIDRLIVLNGGKIVKDVF